MHTAGVGRTHMDSRVSDHDTHTWVKVLRCESDTLSQMLQVWWEGLFNNKDVRLPILTADHCNAWAMTMPPLYAR